MVGPELVWLGLYGFGKRKAAKASMASITNWVIFYFGFCTHVFPFDIKSLDV